MPKNLDLQDLIHFCKYYDNGACPYLQDFQKKLDELLYAENAVSLQPRCPRDAQRNKKGVLCCWCKRRDILC